MNFYFANGEIKINSYLEEIPDIGQNEAGVGILLTSCYKPNLCNGFVLLSFLKSEAYRLTVVCCMCMDPCFCLWECFLLVSGCVLAKHFSLVKGSFSV